MGNGVSRRGLLSAFGLAVAVALLALSGWASGGVARLLGQREARPLFDEGTVVRLYRRVSPAVVEVLVSRGGTLGGQPVEGGSGFLVDREGYLVTNHHVIEGAEGVYVRLADGRVVEAEVVGRAPRSDLALLRVDAEAVGGVAPVTLGDSAQVRPGQLAVALGSPLGLERSVTVGVVSGVGRRLNSGPWPISGALQLDVSLNPGNSGGPLLNSQGEVVGINTAIQASALDPHDGRVGGSIGFAIPINHLKGLLPRLKEGGVVGQPYLGIRGVTVDAALAQRLGLLVDHGVYVCQVLPGTAAVAAGLGGAPGAGEGCAAGGDVVEAVDGRQVEGVSDLRASLEALWPGASVALTVRRGDATLAVPVTLGEEPAEGVG